MRPARVGRDIAADRAGPLARRVGSIMKARSDEGTRQPDVHHPGLDDRVAVANAHFEDALHPGQTDHQTPADRERAAGQAGASPARYERDVVAHAELDDLDDVLGRSREDDHVGHAPLDHVAVALVNQHLVVPVQDVFLPDDGDQVRNDTGSHFRAGTSSGCGDHGELVLTKSCFYRTIVGNRFVQCSFYYPARAAVSTMPVRKFAHCKSGLAKMPKVQP